MLWKRIATAAVLLPLLVVTVLYGKGWPFALLVLAATLLCAGEYFRMFLPSPRDRWAGVAVTGLTYASGALIPYPAAVSAILLCVGMAAFPFLSVEGTPEGRVRSAALSVLGVVYIGGFLSTWPRTLLLPGGEHWVLLGILVVAAGDTFSYFVGRAFGKTPLSPRLSPNKTVEGSIGGLLASVLSAAAYAAVFLPAVQTGFILVAAALLGAAGQGGDLFESMLKRAAGVKDSGTLLPGHGGMLDRADGIIAAGPVLHLLAVVSRQTGGA
ncbi:MAG TPA: phosphatidate cytidylyltransferase [Candidatus Limnocylindrales bacterium]|nr:phosphatidate cytidylyltransferase [Candidatus Limnocylindrales bacterium]